MKRWHDDWSFKKLLKWSKELCTLCCPIGFKFGVVCNSKMYQRFIPHLKCQLRPKKYFESYKISILTNFWSSSFDDQGKWQIFHFNLWLFIYSSLLNNGKCYNKYVLLLNWFFIQEDLFSSSISFALQCWSSPAGSIISIHMLR